MRRKEENEVGKPLEQSTGREIGGMEARIEESNGEKGGEWSGKAWRTEDKQGDWRKEARREESNGEKGGEWSGTACQRKMERQGLGTEGNNGEMQRQARMRGE
jgi:hypothetical protein